MTEQRSFSFLDCRILICGHTGIRVGTAPLILPTAACPGLLQLQLGAEGGHRPEETAPLPSKYALQK